MKRFTVIVYETGGGDCEVRSWLAFDAASARKHRAAIKLLGLGGDEDEIEKQALFHVVVSNDHKGLRVSKEFRSKGGVLAAIENVLGLFNRFGKDKQVELKAFMDGEEDEFSFSDGVSDSVRVTRAYSMLHGMISA